MIIFVITVVLAVQTTVMASITVISMIIIQM